MECEGFLDELEKTGAGPDVEEVVVTMLPDMSTTAYEAVRKRWIKRGIWDRRWGILPGMWWKHEELLEEFLRREMGVDYYPGPTPYLPDSARRNGTQLLRRRAGLVDVTDG